MKPLAGIWMGNYMTNTGGPNYSISVYRYPPILLLRHLDSPAQPFWRVPCPVVVMLDQSFSMVFNLSLSGLLLFRHKFTVLYQDNDFLI
jgi:hypothetical protein